MLGFLCVTSRACGLCRRRSRVCTTRFKEKMADEKNHEDEKSDVDGEDTPQNDEKIVNGDGDDSEFDDPEGFVDDITDEGKNWKRFLRGRFNEFKDRLSTLSHINLLKFILCKALFERNTSTKRYFKHSSIV